MLPASTRRRLRASLSRGDGRRAEARIGQNIPLGGPPKPPQFGENDLSPNCGLNEAPNSEAMAGMTDNSQFAIPDEAI